MQHRREMTILGKLASVLPVARSGRLLAVRSFARQTQDKPGRPVSRTVEAHIAAVLLRKGRSRQLSLDFGLAADTKAMDTIWRGAEEGERRSRARFAQNTIKPEEVIPEWQRWRDLLGGPDQVRRFVERSMSRLDAALKRIPVILKHTLHA